MLFSVDNDNDEYEYAMKFNYMKCGKCVEQNLRYLSIAIDPSLISKLRMTMRGDYLRD